MRVADREEMVVKLLVIGDRKRFEKFLPDRDIVKQVEVAVAERGSSDAEVVALAGDADVIACNAIGHLCAGLHQLNRTGDDTSGFEWHRTARMGVNTLAFRNCQNGHFYMSDADCVGITGAIDWELNKNWLFALSRSGSPLFVSCKPGILSENQLAELKEAYRINSLQTDEFIPVDWMETTAPDTYLLNGRQISLNWYEKCGNKIFSEWL